MGKTLLAVLLVLSLTLTGCSAPRYEMYRVGDDSAEFYRLDKQTGDVVLVDEAVPLLIGDSKHALDKTFKTIYGTTKTTQLNLKTHYKNGALYYTIFINLDTKLPYISLGKFLQVRLLSKNGITLHKFDIESEHIRETASGNCPEKSYCYESEDFEFVHPEILKDVSDWSIATYNTDKEYGTIRGTNVLHSLPSLAKSRILGGGRGK